MQRRNLNFRVKFGKVLWMYGNQPTNQNKQDKDQTKEVIK